MFGNEKFKRFQIFFRSFISTSKITFRLIQNFKSAFYLLRICFEKKKTMLKKKLTLNYLKSFLKVFPNTTVPVFSRIKIIIIIQYYNIMSSFYLTFNRH